MSSELVVIVSAALTVKENCCVSDCDNASVTRSVKVDVPVLVGVPEMIPAGLSVKFAGNEPMVRLQTSEPVPPAAVKVWLYGRPTVAPGRGEVEVMFGGADGLIKMERDCVSACLVVSVTRTVKADAPTAVGVPEMRPVWKLKPRFWGSEPAAMLQEKGGVPPVAWIVRLYGWPTFPAGSEVVAIASTAGAALIVSGKEICVACAGLEESLKVNVCVLVPTVSGVPLIAPVDESRTRLRGRGGSTDHR